MLKKLAALVCIVVLCLTMVSIASADNVVSTDDDTSSYEASTCQHSYVDYPRVNGKNPYDGYVKLSEAMHRYEKRMKQYCLNCPSMTYRVESYYNEVHELLSTGNWHDGFSHVYSYECSKCHATTKTSEYCPGPPCAIHM